MPEVVFVSTLEPKDGRREELVELLAELAKQIRGEPGYLQYSVHRPLGEDKGPLLVIQRYTSLEAYQEHSSWARGQAPRISELLATPPAPPVLFEPVPLGDDASQLGGSVPERLSYSLATRRGPTGAVWRPSWFAGAARPLLTPSRDKSAR